MTEQPSVARAQQGIISLDILRGAAAFLVFFGHLRQSAFVAYSALPLEDHSPLVLAVFSLARMGRESVMVFFVLSGFLVGGQLIRRLADGRFDVRSYALERSTRIFIPLIPACLLTYLVGRFILGDFLAWPQVLMNMVGLNGILAPTMARNVPLWTLSYEIWFYLVAGAFAYALYAKRVSWPAIAILTAGLGVFTILSARYLLYWGLGAICVKLLNHPDRKVLALIGFVTAMGGVVANQLLSDFTLAGAPMPAIGEFLVCIGTGLCIPMLCDPAVNSKIEFLRRPALYIGGMSYSLYLFHFPINLALGQIFPQLSDVSALTVSLFLLRLTLNVFLAWIAFLMFEANTVRVRNYLQRSIGKSAQ